MFDFDLNGPPFLALLVSIFWVALAILWIVQFVELMSLEDEDFPGAWVRLGWVAGFVLLWMATPVAFWIWSRRRDGLSIVPLAGFSEPSAVERRAERQRRRGQGADPGSPASPDDDRSTTT